MIIQPSLPTTLDYFPDCVLPSCGDTSGRVHQHILPHQQDMLNCTTKYLYVQGGVGSAKSMALAAKCVQLCMEISNNVGVVSRRDYKLLYRSSWREIKQCIKRLVDRSLIDYDYWSKNMYSHKVQGDYSVITFPNGSQLFAVQGKNFTEALGPSYGFFWVDDAMESFQEFFIGDDTSAGLLSRLREPVIHFDKSTYDEVTRPHGSLHGMVSSNPPPINHWLHKLFGNKPGVHKLGEDSITWMLVETNQNPFTGGDYSKGLISIQNRMGGSANTIRRIIGGESVPAYGGIPVFPQFDHKIHVAPLKVRKDLPVIVGVDFGYQHPAATFSNLYKCKYGSNHYFTVSEVTECFNDTVYVFYDKHLKPHIDALYKDCTLVWGGDRAGYRGSSSNKDKRGDMKILMHEYKIPFRWKYLNVEPSLQYMRGLLQPKVPCKCGLPLVLISNKCPVLIGALEGGYKYPRSKESVSVNSKPIEDLYFSDTACAWRYGAENYVRFGLSWQDQKTLKESTQRQHLPKPQIIEDTLAFLEVTDQELVAMMRG